MDRLAGWGKSQSITGRRLDLRAQLLQVGQAFQPDVHIPDALRLESLTYKYGRIVH